MFTSFSAAPDNLERGKYGDRIVTASQEMFITATGESYLLGLSADKGLVFFR